MQRNPKRKIIIVIVFILILTASFLIYSKFQPTKADDKYQRPSSEAVVRQYFSAWSNEDYANMYATISDGFKKIEPTANSLVSFRDYAESQGINNINILSIKEKSNDGRTAEVDYSVEFLLSSGQKQKFDGSFTLKYRKGDIIPGWKLIHPYGENIDTS